MLERIRGNFTKSIGKRFFSVEFAKIFFYISDHVALPSLIWIGRIWLQPVTRYAQVGMPSVNIFNCSHIASQYLIHFLPQGTIEGVSASAFREKMDIVAGTTSNE